MGLGLVTVNFNYDLKILIAKKNVVTGIILGTIQKRTTAIYKQCTL